MAFRKVWWLQRMLSTRAAQASIAILIVIVVAAVLAPWIRPHDPNVQDIANALQGPSGDHWLGTDQFGRDTFSRLLMASRVTLVAAVEGLGVAVLIGMPLGLLGGYVRGLIDATLSRIADGFLALPSLVLALAIIGMLGTGITNAVIAIGVTLAPRFFRVARGASMSASAEGFVEAAKADGCSTWRILTRHILPNASGPLLVQASFGIGLVISAEASLSFLGLGVQPPSASWGSMIRDGYNVIYSSRTPILPPALMVAITALAVFVIGDSLRDALRGRS